MGYGNSILYHDRQVFWLTRSTLAFPPWHAEQWLLIRPYFNPETKENRFLK